MLLQTALLLLALTVTADDTLQNPTDKTVQVDAKPFFASVRLRADSVIAPGSEFAVSILLSDTTQPVGGFNLLIEYDFGALVFDSALRGDLTHGEWEYFAVRSDLLDKTEEADHRAFVRLVGIADSNDPENKTPSPRSLVGPGELVRLYFYATDHSDYYGKPTSLRFRWDKCDDNSFSDLSGNRLYLSRYVFDYDGKIISDSVGIYSGSPSRCVTRSISPPIRAFDFCSAKFVIRSIVSPIDSAIKE